MYAVIKTGGKQYRVQPGDLVVVEKLDGEPGAEVRLDQVLMLGDDKGVSVGAPTVDGAFASAVLVETRKGEKVKVFKKIRRQGYRRTQGHRQLESVLRVTGLSGDGKSAKWDGTVDLTTKAEMNARARGLAPRVEAEVEAKPTKVAKPAKAPVEAAPEAEAKTEARPAKKAAPKAAKAEAAPATEAAAEKPAAKKAPAKKAATKAKPASTDEA